MSLKQLINTLFKLSGGQALPSGSSIDLPIPTSGQWSQTFTAASDGYVEAYFLNSKAVEISNTTTKIRAKNETNISAGAYIPFAKVISLMCTSITRIQLMPFLNLLRRSALLSFTQEVCHG